MTVLGSSILWIIPGNCSGSYILLGNLRAVCSKWTLPPRLIDATMFWIVTVASFFILILPFLNFWTTLLIAFLANSSDFAPVHTIFPVLNSNVAVFGDFSLKTAPGNSFGFHSTSGNFFVISLRSNLWSIVAEATTFTMLISGLDWGISFWV